MASDNIIDVNAIEMDMLDEGDQLMKDDNQYNMNSTDMKILGNAFIYRDLSDGKSRSLKYDTKCFPKELTHRIEKSEFYSCIREINLVLSPLNQTSIFNFLESMFLLLTCFITSNKMFRWTRYDSHLKRLNELIHSQNKEVFIPRGLQLLPPLRTGLRCLQIVIYDIDHYIDKLGVEPNNQNINNNNNSNLNNLRNQEIKPINIIASSPTRDSAFHTPVTDSNLASIQAKSPTFLMHQKQQHEQHFTRGNQLIKTVEYTETYQSSSYTVHKGSTAV